MDFDREIRPVEQDREQVEQVSPEQGKLARHGSRSP